MNLSDNGKKYLMSIETYRGAPYDDQSGCEIHEWRKGATIGYGHLISLDEWRVFRSGITDDQAKKLFDHDIAPVVDAVNANIKVSVLQHQFDALVMLAYNIGIRGFTHSSALKLINKPSTRTPYRDLESAWKAWNKSQGKVMQGLINRRNAEWKIFTENVYEYW